MKNSVLVIYSRDHEDNEKTVIGVADSLDKAKEMIVVYFGEYKELSHTDFTGNDLEWAKELSVKGAFNEFYTVTVTLEWFILNEV